jgi:SWI/SNF-related matrix-associated actin-dependent regulator of chromatin subfamily A-like protein 1
MLDKPLPFPRFKDRTLRDLLTSGNPQERSYVEWMARDFRDERWRAAAQEALKLGDAQLVDSRLVYTLGMASDKAASLRCAYDQRVAALLRARVDGINWRRAADQWEFPATQIASVVALLGELGEVRLSAAALDALNQELARRARLDEIRGLSDTGIEIPTLLPLFDFQRVGVEFVLAAGGRAIIADDMGIGKTVQAIGASLMLMQSGDVQRVLTLCPASLKINWYREWIRFAGIEPTVWYGPKHKGPEDNSVHIINFDIFRQHRERFEELGFQFLIVDEAHYLKNKDSQRTQAVFGGYNRKRRRRYKPFAVPYAVLLTGTPVLNRPGELFPLLHYVAPDRFNDWSGFADRYGAWTPGNMQGRPWKPQNLLELHERTKDIVIRRRKSDVLGDLPPLMVSDVFVELSAAQRQAYRKVLGQVASEWKSSRPTLETLQLLTGLLNQYKLDRVREIIDELRSADRSVLVFCTRLDPLRTLLEEYPDCSVYIDGSMSPDQRQQSVDRFQHGDATVALLSLRAAGVGLTLTKADTVIFIDQDFVPANHAQAEARAHRIGQVNPVQVYYIMAEGTIDEDLRVLLAEKLVITGQIADGEIQQVERERSVFQDFVRRLKERHRQFSKVDDTIGFAEEAA